MDFLDLHQFIRNAAEWKSQKAKVWKKRAAGSFLRLCLVEKKKVRPNSPHCGFQHWLNTKQTSTGVRKERKAHISCDKKKAQHPLQNRSADFLSISRSTSLQQLAHSKFQHRIKTLRLFPRVHFQPGLAAAKISAWRGSIPASEDELWETYISPYKNGNIRGGFKLLSLSTADTD